jgi:ubiquinone/menaquinone biosynthesis C-methylase UbiE
MTTDFDAAATVYDVTFTHSVIGKAQRKYVYGLLSEALKKSQPKKILEINCGTGEDAIWLARQHFDVVATDISEKMIEVARSKSAHGNLIFEQVDINELPRHFKGEKFDLIFSNFGGLNCLPPMGLERFFKNASELLTQNGRLLLVIMPKNTKWEQAYFLAKADFKNVFRRKKTSAIANVDGQNVLTYYYNPKETARLANRHFDLDQINPIGFFVPPSYLEPFFKKHPTLFSVLDAFEPMVKHWSFLAKHADHYFIYFRKR